MGGPEMDPERTPRLRPVPEPELTLHGLDGARSVREAPIFTGLEFLFPMTILPTVEGL